MVWFNTLLNSIKDVFLNHDFFEVFTGIATSITIIIGLITFIKRASQNRRYSKLNLSGFFISKRKLTKSGKTIYDLVKVRASIFNIIGRPYYVFKDQDYKLKLFFSKEHHSVIKGDWKSLKDTKNYGSFGWNYSDEKLFGFWSSTTRKGNIDFGDWQLIKLNAEVTKQLKNELSSKFFYRYRRFCKYQIKRRNDSTLHDEIIRKHIDEPTKPFVFRNRIYDIYKYIFNPQFGKIGIPLIDYLLDNYDFEKFSKVLEWGTGCGYYSIEIAKKFESINLQNQITTIEKNPTAVQCALHNLSKHKVANMVSLKQGDRISDVVSLDQLSFDLIIANLPFSRPETIRKHKKSELYGCFCASSDLIFNMCFELKNYLKPDGIALITFADSGNESFFRNCLEFVELFANELFRIDQDNGATDDVFYVYEIKHKEIQ